MYLKYLTVSAVRFAVLLFQCVGHWKAGDHVALLKDGLQLLLLVVLLFVRQRRRKEMPTRSQPAARSTWIRRNRANRSKPTYRE